LRYRVLGRTGLRVSELGFGGHEYRRWLNTYHFPGDYDREEFLKTQPERNGFVERAIDSGVNFFDTTLREEAESLGSALKTLGRRRDVHVAAMIVFPFRKMDEGPRTEWRDVIIDGVEDRLRTLQTDYIDIFNIHMPEDHYSSDKLKMALGALEEFREQGKIGWIGASSHELRFLAELIRRYDCFDSIMVRYNFHLQEAEKVIFPLTKALEVGVVVMKPFSWPHYGIPFMRFGPLEGEEDSSRPAQHSLRWILRASEVGTVVSGMNRLDELEMNVDAVEKQGEVDENILDRYLRASQSPAAKDVLMEMLSEPAIDLRNYARRALASFSE